MEEQQLTFTVIDSVRRDANGRKIIGDYIILKQRLGEGNFCHVKLCQHIITGKHYAVKVYHTVVLARAREFRSARSATGGLQFTTVLDKVSREIALMQSCLEHDAAISDCVTLREVYLVRAPAREALGMPRGTTGPLGAYGPSKLYLVMDYLEVGSVMTPSFHAAECTEEPVVDTVDETVRSDMSKAPVYQGLLIPWDTVVCPDPPCLSWGYPEALAKCVFKDAATGVQFLHERSIVHRDVKPDNLLMGADGHVRLADLSVAAKLPPDGRVRGTEGTYAFLPPECTRDDDGTAYSGHDGKAADAWSLGVTLWVLLFGTLPFYVTGLENLFNAIATAEVHIPRGCRVTSECEDILRRLFCKEPLERLSVRQALEHPWLRNVDYSVAQRFATSVLEKRRKTQQARSV